MPKFPRVSGKSVIRALERMGFIVKRQKGSHVVLRKSNFGCVVPIHKELASGTLRSILKQAKISLEELEENL